MVRRRSGTFNLLMACLAIGGMSTSVLCDLPLRTSSFAGSDMKTLFASVWCFAHGLNAYTIANVQSVFAAHDVIFPGNWFGHAPVYPPTTLALLLPLTALPMVPAVYGVVVVSAALFAIAAAALVLRAAKDACPLAGRAAIVAACACCPLFSFALSMGNVSVAASALCIVTFIRRKHGTGWLYGALLAIAVLLKPHLALWMLTGMFLLPERAARAVAARAALIAGSFASLVVAALAIARHLRLETHGFAEILRAETSGGSSMSPSSHEVVPIYAQVSSLHSLLGFWWQSSVAESVFAAAILVALGAVVAWRIRAARTEQESVPAIGAWLAFGLLATYHRAHDALVLLVLLPWLIETIRRAPRLWHPWTIMFLYGAFNLSASFDLVRLRVADGEYNSLIAFLLLRQAALANLGLLLVLLASTAGAKRYFRATDEMAPTRQALVAS